MWRQIRKGIDSKTEGGGCNVVENRQPLKLPAQGSGPLEGGVKKDLEGALGQGPKHTGYLGGNVANIKLGATRNGEKTD